MNRILNSFRVTSLNKLGRCVFCMRTSAASAAIAWAMGFAVLAATRQTAIATLLMVAAGAFTALWLAHLTAYSVRSARCRISTPTIDNAGIVTRFSRRDLLPMFARTFAFAAIATVLPALFSKAKADDEGCSGDTPYGCGTQYCCAGSALWHCSGYTGSVENWRSLGSFCTNANSDEDVADLRSNCAELVHC